MTATSLPPLAHTTVVIVGRPFLTIWSPEDGAVRAAGFWALPSETAESAPTLWDAADAEGDQLRDPLRAPTTDPTSDPLWARLAESDPATAARGLDAIPTASGHIVSALQAYAQGDMTALDELQVRQRETPFRAEVWAALRALPAGTAVTYTELAERAGRPSAVRAAASGCANNLVALIVPCHRIVRRDGGLGGYLFGTETKRRLLELEGAA